MYGDKMDWIKKGLSDAEGSMDEARVTAMLMMLSYIAIGVIGAMRAEMKDMAAFGAFMQAYGIGGAALAAGIGGWFKLRGVN